MSVDKSIVLKNLFGDKTHVVTVVLENVVLDKRAGSPAVDRQVGVAVRVEVGIEGDGPVGTGAPALACDKVLHAGGPGHRVLATVAIGVGHVAAADPERVVVVTAGAGGAGRQTLVQVAAGDSLGGDAGDGGGGGEQGGEGDHFCCGGLNVYVDILCEKGLYVCTV